MSQVYVGNLNPRVLDKTIQDEFRPYFSVGITRKSPNYAFVDFDDRNHALQAIRNLDGLHGWKVKPSYYNKGGGRVVGGESTPDSCAKNKCNPCGDGQEKWRIRGNRSYSDGDQSKIVVCEVPASQKCNQDNLGSNPVGVEPGKPSVDECSFSRGNYRIATPSRKIDLSSSKSYTKNKFNPDHEKEARCKWQIRENKTSGDQYQSKVIVDESPVSQQCNRDNVESKQFEQQKQSIDELASKLNSELEEKIRELGSVNEENENLKHKLNEGNAEMSSAKAMVEEMTLKLKKLGEELEETKNRLTFSKDKGDDMFLMIKKLKAELVKSKYNVSSAKAKESEISMKLKKVQDELEKVKSNASSSKKKEEETSMKLKKLEEKLRNSEKFADQLNEKLKEAQRVKETLQSEMKCINEKTDEWRKTADAAAAIFSVGVEINTEISEFESLFSSYMNRAATQLSVKRVRESLLYLRMAATLEPNSFEPYLKSAECHLTLGEVEDALYYYSKCSKSGSIPCLDRRVSIEAANGIQKAQKVVSCIKHSAELVEQRTLSSATIALEVISEAMSISALSDRLLEMQGEALFVAVQHGEKTLYLAQKNFAIVCVANEGANVDRKSLSKLWRWNLMSKSYFRLGKLDIALIFIEKQENLRSIEDKIEESKSRLAATVRELLHFKNAGNEAFQSGMYTEAVKHYTNALSTSTESRPFAAVCLSNRAAAYEALNKIIDAISDCNLALALDGNYQKALFRRAKLHEVIRNYETSASDFKRLISLIEKQSPGKKSRIDGQDLSHRLSYIEEKAKRRTTMDLYLILGVNDSDSASEIKKAYRRAALSHHPDKAGQFLARSDSGYDGELWKEISKTISMDADELFKIIGEAYSVLSDSSKRSKYDNEVGRRDDDEEENYDEDY